ncbi:hypothetical protein KKC00_03455 [Patescibacteria group bacterium]|nr:hypothetical protein [Patescibacteria group bacterium]
MFSQTPNRELILFWQSEVFPFINSLSSLSFNGRKLHEIIRRYNELTSAIQSRYKQGIFVNAVEKNPLASGRHFVFGCTVERGRPEIFILVPELQKLFLKIKGSFPREYKQYFIISLVIAYIHELDHLASGNVGNATNIAEQIEGEIIVWADTCEKTISLFAEVYGIAIYPGDLLMYSRWIDSGRNVNSEQWRFHIATMYGFPNKPVF